MNSRQFRAHAATGRALAFLSQSRITEPAIVELREELRAADARLVDTWMTQQNATRMLGAHGAKLERLKEELRVDHLLTVSRRGQLLLRGLPGIKDSLRVPHFRASSDEFLEAAKRIATAVRPHVKAFRRAKFAPDFLKRLERAAAALAAEAANPNGAMATRSVATSAVKDEVAEARRIIRSIDSLIASKFRGNPAAIAEWRAAKRIGGRIGRPRKRK